MNIIRKLVGFLLALSLATVAAPALAQNVKYFSLNFTTPNASNVTTTTTEIYLAYKNLETSNSTFNAVSVKGVASATAGVKITALQAVGLPGGAVGTPLKISDTEWRLGDLPPTKKGQTLVVKATVQITATSCSGGTLTWIGGAWTGSVSSPSTDFQQANANPVSTVAGSCSYSVSGTSSVVRGATTATQVVVSITNSANSTQGITDVTLGAPAGVQVSSTTKNGFPIAAGGTGTITMNVTAPCNAGAAAGWTVTAISPTGFSTTPASNSSLLTPTGACDLKFTQFPSSFASGTASEIKVAFVDGAGNPIGGVPGTVSTIVASGSCTIDPNPTTADLSAGGVATLSITLTGSPGACKIKASMGDYQKTSESFTLYAGILGCTSAANPPFPPVPGPGYFAVLPTGVTSITDVGFAAGYRVLNDKTGDCPFDLNYTLTNNIKGSGSTADGVGNTIPKNWVSFVWDLAMEQNAVFTYTATFQPEYVDATTGLPAARSKFCVLNLTGTTDCTDSSKWQALKACLAPTLSSTSIPGSDPACIAREEWETVDASQCPTWTGSGDAPACVRVTQRFIDARDPPIGRNL